MDVELLEIRDFLAAHPPFDRLPDEVLDRLPLELSVRYLRRGTPFPPPDADGAYLYLVRSGALELRDTKKELLGKYGEGEIWNSPCDQEELGTDLRVYTVEDSLFYLLPCERVAQLRQRYPTFDELFERSIRERLKRAIDALQQSCSSGIGLLTVEVSRLVTRAPVQVEPQISIREAAQLMNQERISALLVSEGGVLLGIMTDRDLRHAVAEAIPYEQPVSAIMSRKLHKVTRETSAFEALITMTRLNVHHLPVMGRDGVCGLISTTDLVRYQSANPIFLVGDVRTCGSVEELARVATQLPELQVQIVSAGATAYHLGHAIASVTDAITQRLIELAEIRLGPPPLPYVWIAGGSQGRREQTIHTDQDNGIIIDDAYDAERHDSWFGALAHFVNDGLDLCGFSRCPGEVMASNPRWRQPLRVWRDYFHDWILHAERKKAMLAVNFLDTRAIYGESLLHDKLHAEAVALAKENKVFHAYLAANSLTNSPPLGFFRNFVLVSDGDHAKSLDVKHRAIIPIVDLARLHALAAGLPEINSLERLRAAAELGAMPAETAADLEDALEFIATLRARHQARQTTHGEVADNYVKPAELSPLERSHLKDAFSVIRTVQNALSQRNQGGRLY